MKAENVDYIIEKYYDPKDFSRFERAISEMMHFEHLATEYQSPETQADLELAKAVKTVFEFLDEEASVEGVNSDGFWRFDSIGELVEWYHKEEPDEQK